MEQNQNRQTDHLGVKKMGKNIKKSPLHQPQPHVYNINKNDFRNIVQQLTGSPSRDPPPQNHPKPPNNRLQRVRPPPLAQTPQFDHHQPPLPPTPQDVWANTTESPISAYMRYLQNSIIHTGPRQPQPFPQAHLNDAPPPPALPSPTSQFLLNSPTSFLNMLSPGSPYPISPNFSFSSMAQSGLLGPGPHPPPSPGYGFPSGLFPLPSPRWRNQ